MTQLIALDLFAGHGWGVACQQLGIREYGVEIMPEAVATRDAAGMTTIFRDVWDGLEDPSLVPAHDILIASPPCQTFSVAGKGAGRKALDDVLRLIDDIGEAYLDGERVPPARLREYAASLGDDRTALVLIPLLYALRDLPTYITFEQVPTVLPVWEACADVLRDAGYSVATGILNAEQYGVPQTRRRAILVARRDGIEAALPVPTHSHYYSRDPQRFDPDVLPWVSMAEALGWGMTHRPYLSIASGTESGGGTDPAALGGSGARRTVLRERSDGRWVPADEGHEGSAPATSEPTWSFRRPSTTVVGSFRPDIVAAPGYRTTTSRQNAEGSVRVTAAEAAVLQSYPADFPFQGPKTKQFLQIGNAVPPLLARAILSTFIEAK